MQPGEFSDLGQVLHKNGHKEYLTYSSTELQGWIEMQGKVFCKIEVAIQILVWSLTHFIMQKECDGHKWINSLVMQLTQ